MLWVNLSPGQADDSDFQRRIDRQVERYGYDVYGLYLGSAKGRLGTPTPRYRSVTVEELEGSIDAAGEPI